MNSNRILYDYITRQYGSVVDFSAESGISLIDLNAVLLKDNVFEEIRIGLNLCEILNIDVGEIVTNGEIKEIKEIKEKSKQIKSVKSAKPAKSVKTEIYSKCIRLSESEKTRVLEYIESISGEK